MTTTPSVQSRWQRSYRDSALAYREYPGILSRVGWDIPPDMVYIWYIYGIYGYGYGIYIYKLRRSLEPTAHLCPPGGSQMDSQSKPRRNVILINEV